MQNRHQYYRHGIESLLSRIAMQDSHYHEVSLLQMRFEMSVAHLHEYGWHNPSEKSEFLMVLDALSRICVETTAMNFEMLCTMLNEVEQKHFFSEHEIMHPSIDLWQTMQIEDHQQRLLNNLRKYGVDLHMGRKVLIEDPLTRYKAVPLHAHILYTSQDLHVAAYISQCWDSLDSMSRNFCDIIQSHAQFCGIEDAYDFLENSFVLQKSGLHIDIATLPGILFWDHNVQATFISFGQHFSVIEITKLLRTIFEALWKEPSITSIERISVSQCLEGL